ncbi:hypothetical protein D8674_005502 [Pyrus ussuriensis x Pyrus communis]|uniref:Protein SPOROCYTELESS-like n=1 Tax=Pyrus ussuriensis x Pyrus communis TaxID=2448454 RepID=A0A5N5FRP1_9ROSA|nr:hypothetical protein D8674_005502 [Pyrus ussuriensis x Pyrus communis]
MATPMLLMASERSTTKQPAKTFFGSYDESKPEPAKHTKPTKKSAAKASSNTKKQPQRGLGVAQLERLRLQESKKMTEIPQLQPRPQFLDLSPLPHHHHHQYQNPLTLPDPLNSIPVQYGASGLNGPAVINGCGGSAATTADFYGLVGQRVGNGSVFGYVWGNNLVANLDPGPFGFGAPDPRVQSGVVYETSRELSSMPKIQSLSSDCCDLCLKGLQKKRFHSGSYMGFNDRSDKSAAVSPIKSSDFLGLDAEAGGFGAGVVNRSARYLWPSNLLDDQGVEVRAVHRKGGSACGGIFMEYEFFPAADHQKRDETMKRGGTYPKELGMLQLQTVEEEEEASDITAATKNGYGIGAADSYHHHHHHHHHHLTPVDLSLKLSF